MQRMVDTEIFADLFTSGKSLTLVNGSNREIRIGPVTTHGYLTLEQSLL